MSLFNRRRDEMNEDNYQPSNNFDRDWKIEQSDNNIPTGQAYNGYANQQNIRDRYAPNNYSNNQNDMGNNMPPNPNANGGYGTSSRAAYTSGMNSAYGNNYTPNIPNTPPPQPMNNSGYSAPMNMINDKITNNSGASNLVISTPHNFGDVKSLIISLRNNQAVIVDIGNIVESDAYRIMDYLSGAIFALNGSIQKISKNFYALAPHGLSITIPHDIQNRLNKENK